MGYFAALPKVRQSLSIGDSIFLNNRGVRLPSPVFEDGSLWVLATFVLGIILTIFLRKWAINRQEETGRATPLGLISITLIIILPIIVIKRTSVGFDDAMPLSFDNDVQGKFISVIRSSSGWSKNNRYDRFAVLTGQKPVQEFVKTGMPDFVVCSYSIVMMTSFIEQMNDLNSLFIEHLETYFGDQTSYRFLSSLEGGIANEIEMESRGERIIRNEFTMNIKGYMIPEFTDNVFGKTAELGRAYTPKKVSFSEKLL